MPQRNQCKSECRQCCGCAPLVCHVLHMFLRLQPFHSTIAQTYHSRLSSYRYGCSCLDRCQRCWFALGTGSRGGPTDPRAQRSTFPGPRANRWAIEDGSRCRDRRFVGCRGVWFRYGTVDHVRVSIPCVALSICVFDLMVDSTCHTFRVCLCYVYIVFVTLIMKLNGIPV